MSQNKSQKHSPQQIQLSSVIEQVPKSQMRELVQAIKKATDPKKQSQKEKAV